MAATYTKTCPDCGAVNDSNDLFCKDCGTSLAMVSSGQQTSAFTPISSETQTTSIAPVAPAAQEQMAYAPQPQVPVQTSQTYTPPPESSRGAVLGWLAATLMLIIVAAFVYSTLISDATRDRITGIF